LAAPCTVLPTAGMFGKPLGDATNLSTRTHGKNTAPDFAFPYPAYDIQLAFMNHLYRALAEQPSPQERDGDDGARVAVMESPTGTGKSLSIICASLAWLREVKARDAAAAAATSTTEARVGAVATAATAEPDWIEAFDPQQLLQDDRNVSRRRREAKLNGRIRRRLRRGGASSLRRGAGGAPEDEFLLDDVGAAAAVEIGYSSSSSEDSGGGGGGVASDDGSDSASEGEDGRAQILFCSRTHSQLAQVS
jgi:chromosome transmission fidelity protein 1